MTMSARSRQTASQQTELPLTPSAEVSHANRSAQRLEVVGEHSISGLKCAGSSQNSGHPSLSPKTSKSFPSSGHPGSLKTSDIAQSGYVLEQMTQGRTIREIVGGPLHTPTTKANFTAPSMQKWPCCRRYVQAFGGRKITPEQFEFLMGYPIGWTDLSS